MKKFFHSLFLFFFNVSYADQKGIDIAKETVKRNTGWIALKLFFK